MFRPRAHRQTLGRTRPDGTHLHRGYAAHDQSPSGRIALLCLRLLRRRLGPASSDCYMRISINIERFKPQGTASSHGLLTLLDLSLLSSSDILNPVGAKVILPSKWLALSHPSFRLNTDDVCG